MTTTGVSTAISPPQSIAHARARAAPNEVEPEKKPLRAPTNPISRRLIHVICLLAMGTSSVDRMLQIAKKDDPGETHWKEFKGALFLRVGNVNVVSSLILATTAAFLTTTPPTEIARWDHPMPYVTLLAAFCLAYLGAGSGVFLLFVLADSQAESFRSYSGIDE